MKWRIACLVLTVAWMLPVTAPAAQDLEVRYRKAAETFHQLRDESPKDLPGWRKVASSFYSIFESSARHPRGADGLFSAALSMRAAYHHGRDAGDRTRSVAWFRQFVRMYPGHKLADDSLMHIAALYALDGLDPESAYETYLQVLTDYPRGDQAALAREFTDAFASKESPASAQTVAYREPVSNNIRPAVHQSPLQESSHDGENESLAEPEEQDDEAVDSAPLNKLAEGGTKGRSDKKTTSGAPINSKNDDGSSGNPVKLKNIEFWAMKNWTRVVITLDREAGYLSRELPPAKDLPPRFYMDLQGTMPVDGIPTTRIVKDGQLKKIRVSRRADGATRVVLDLNQDGKVEVKNLDLPLEKKIFVDLYPPKPKEIKPAPQMELAKVQSLKSALGLKVKTIVLDPGHGGHDPGAVAFGQQEKYLALDIAKRLQKVFKQHRPDIRVLMTREDDVFIPLAERPELARRMGADLFISIHLNAHVQERFSGVETYFLNLTTDASALQVAARENAMGTMQVGDLNQILRDLLRDTNIVESSRLANDLQDSLVNNLRENARVKNLGVKQAPFMVLVGSDVPGVLVEAGFLTNRKENKRLRDSSYRDQVAEGIYAGLRKYIDAQNVAVESGRPGSNPGKS